MNSSLSCSDASFGPAVEGCDRTFDFTVAFEESILSIVPSVLLILVAPIRILLLKGQRRRVGGRAFQRAKLSAIGLFAVLQLALLLLRSLRTAQRTTLAISAAALSFVDAFIFCMLSYTEHSKSLRPSALLGVYLFFSLLFDVARVRTLWLIGYDGGIRGIFTASLVMKVMILLLEAKEKRRYFNSSDRQKGPEETSGIFSQSVFWWLNNLIGRGFSKVLLMDDLYPIDEDLLSEKLGTSFRERWKTSPKGGKYRLMFTLVKLFKWQIMLPVFPRLCLVALTFCQPLLINRYLQFLQDPTENMNIGYGLLGAYAVVYFGLAISTGFYWHRVYRWITMVRGTLVSSIYYKTTEISITALDNSAAVTLMSTDVERIEVGLRVTHELWANIIQVGLATWLLQRELGLACLVPIVVAVLSAAGSAGVASRATKRQLRWVKAIQKRVGITSTMLGGMKGVKMSGLTQKLSGLIQQLRVDELAQGTAFRMVLIYCAVFSFIPQQVSPVLTFGTFIGIESSDGRALDTTRVFTSVSLLVLLNQPLSQVFQSFPSIMSAVGCLDRIQKFLSADSRADHRLLSPAAAATPKISPPSTARGSLGRVRVPDDIELVSLKRAVEMPTTSLPAQYQPTTGDSRFFNKKSQSSKPLAGTLPEVILIDSGAFGWKKGEPPILQDINLSILRSQFTILVGPVASGKTTLLKAILGETPSSKGFVHVSTLDFSFCDQTPWLLSQSVQKNILGFANFDSDWYNSVIHACALDEDFALFPQGDQTLIGSNGISLSGGQKQRLAIARAVYAKREVAVFDDVFSGLDATTERHVFDRLFGTSGLLRLNNTTVIVATHAVNLLPWADQIVALSKDGRIAEQGTFTELNALDGSYVRSFALQQAARSVEKELTEPVGVYKLGTNQASAVDTIGDRSRQLGDFSVYKYYFAATGRSAMIIFWLLEISWAFLETFPSVWLKWWSSATTNNENPSTAKYLGVYAALQMGSLLTLFVLAIHAFNTMQIRSGAKLHYATLKTVMAAPLAFFSSTDTGVTLNRFSQDIQLIDGELPNALFNVVANGLACAGQAVLIASATWYIALTFPFLLTIFYYIQKYYLRTSRQLRFMDLEAKSPLYTQFIESLSGLATLRAFEWQQPNHILNNELLDASQRPVYLLYMIQRWLTLVMDFISMGLALVIVGLSLKLRSSVSVGFTGVALVNIISFGEGVKWVVLQWTQLETAIGAVSRTKSFEASTASENLPTEIHTPPPNWPSTGLVNIRSLAITYKPNSGKNVVEDFNLTIQPGEKIGICGRSGSGKSSLVLALFRMIEISAGSIYIDNVDISTLPRQEVRARLNAIPQDPYFLYGTIRSNLDPWDAQSDEKLVEALQKVELWSVIEGKGGLDAEMEVDILSHGQRQLFCLARATLRPGKIVVLDEATSNVDRKTDELMQRIIREEFARHTIIAIAHRLETILDFDKIVVLHKGELKECDSPKNLLARPSAFRELYEMYEMKQEKQ